MEGGDYFFGALRPIVVDVRRVAGGRVIRVLPGEILEVEFWRDCGGGGDGVPKSWRWTGECRRLAPLELSLRGFPPSRPSQHERCPAADTA